MGNQFEFTVITASENEAEKLFEVAITEIQRIEKLLTTFSNDSITAKINEMAGIQAVEVDDEVFQLIKRAQFISKITQGAFDISYGSLDKKFWNFDLQMTSLPNPIVAKKSVALINYENIILDETNQTVFLKNKGKTTTLPPQEKKQAQAAPTAPYLLIKIKFKIKFYKYL